MRQNVLSIHRWHTFFTCTLFLLLLCCCKEENPLTTRTDYSDLSNWLVNSGKAGKGKAVDVFFLYPTTYTGNNHSCAVTDPGMRAGAVRSKDRQASAFINTANLYMPYYRQMNAGYLLRLLLDEQEKLMKEIPVEDAIEAFEYYLDNYNNGRPFFLAGHSQGSSTSIYLLEYLKDKPEVLSRMIAAYIIGYSVTPEYLAKNPHLHFAEGATDTGVIISWNTESPGVTDANPVVLPGALTINPINWNRDESYAAKEQSLGSRIFENNEYNDYPQYADAKIDLQRNVIVCSTIDQKHQNKGSQLFPEGILHGLDYDLYYYDLQKNIQDRTDAYLGLR
ncbi:MAG: DUF3089 domain-containing protein [Bacteroidales bacterium]|nr:DUF3089 domain-containing protein [Bacteroidales bacterium]